MQKHQIGLRLTVATSNIKHTQNNIKRCLQTFASIVFYYPFPPPFQSNVVGFIK